MTHDLFNTRLTFTTGNGSTGTFYPLPQLANAGLGNISRLPVSIRIVLESVLRNFDGGKRVGEPHVRELSRGEQPMSGFERETRHHFDNARHFRE